MQTFTVEQTVSSRFQTKETVDVAIVKATSKKEAIEALKFYVQNGISPLGCEVKTLVQIIDIGMGLNAYKKVSQM
jgi:hypothetical protein